MDLFKNRTFTWWQVGLLKTSLLLIGIVVGANWPQLFVDSTILLLVVALGLGFYLAFVSLRQ